MMPATDGDADRFKRLMLPLLDDVHTLARYLARNSADAEDATQETFLRAFRYFASFSGGSAKAWLFTILRNVLFSRDPARFAPLPEGDEVDALAEPLWSDGAGDPGATLEQKDEAERLHALVRLLPDSYREILTLREFGDLSYREIADLTKLPIGTVMSRLARARERLRLDWLAAETGTTRP